MVLVETFPLSQIHNSFLNIMSLRLVFDSSDLVHLDIHCIIIKKGKLQGHQLRSLEKYK